MDLIFQIIHALLAIGLIAGVLLQSGKSGGLSGAIGGGGTQSFKTKTLDEKLSKITKYVAVLFMISSVLLSFLLGR
ncbi:preprotein translocase subunit SecG [Alkalicella caledoniensis]|uniref:Protein-export membrane protein SecG n=1 Tax=Alkalicella caledoniensis TaxID=2731377 RepID=A0A7G9W6S1_ALKCA|nr:preprotein translocase subunit SecG [Alkalicella caledoniensis]QNO14383.1 preprotein translocase subunit SecG [Alkalicella caledoniensis]